MGASDQPRARPLGCSPRRRLRNACAALDLRLGKAQEPHLDRAHGRVPAETALQPICAEFDARRTLDVNRRDDHVADDKQHHDQQDHERPVRDNGVVEEHDDDHHEHRRHDELTEVPSGISVVTGKPALRAAIACHQVFFFAVGLADAGTLTRQVELVLRFGFRFFCIGYEGALPGGFLLSARGRRAVLTAADGWLDGCIGCGGLGHGRILGFAKGVRSKITCMTSQVSRSDSVRAAAADAVPAALADLGGLVRIPSVAFPGFDRAEVERSAAAVKALVEDLHFFEEVSIRSAIIPETGERGMPAVVATRAARAGRPTILLYAHHDVQPVGDEGEWESAPFEPTVRDGRLYGRGAADDKAGVMAHIGAIRAVTDALGTDVNVGVNLFIEGEEEAGSASFAAFLYENADALRADVIVVADSGNWDAHTPALTVSLRGNTRFTLDIRTLDHASHSGMFGGAVPDAMLAAVTLLATLWDSAGAVAVAGLESRDAVTPDYTEETLRSEAGLPEQVQPIGTGSILSRIWNKPSITITGIDAPSVKNASNTLTPQVSVVISARVAPGQEAKAAFEAVKAHLEQHAPFGAQLSFRDVDFGSPFLVDTSGWAVDQARVALESGYGVAPVDVGVGGSIPFVADLVREFPSAQILVTGVEDPHARAHSPNESLHIDTFRNALISEALLLESLDATTL